MLDAFFVGEQGFAGGDGGDEVGHDDGAGEVSGAEGGDGLEHGVVPQVEVHVEGGVQSHGVGLVNLCLCFCKYSGGIRN